MRVLVVATRAPTPVVDGFTVHLHGLLRALRQRHDVHVVCYGRSLDMEGVTATVLPPPPAAPGSPAARVASALRAVATGVPSDVRRYRAGGIAEAAARVAAGRRFDVAHVTGGPMAFAGDALGALPRVHVPIDAWVLNEVEEARAEGGARLLWRRLKASAIRRHDRRALGRYPVTVVVSEGDREALLGLDPTARVAVVANGVDSDFFAPDPAAERVPGMLVFHGTMDYPPNLDAAQFVTREVLPLIERAVPGVRLRLVGRRPPASIEALRGRAVEVTGEVGDVRPWLAAAEVAICPLRWGTGVKNKVLEAAALGLPIVATPSALGDIDLVPGSEIAVAADAAGLAAAAAELLTSPAKRAAMGTAARRAVVERYSWARAADAFTAVYEEAIGLYEEAVGR